MTPSFFRAATCLVLLVATVTCLTAAPEAPLARQGVLDLRGQDFARQGPVSLAGSWEFHWATLVPPAAFPPGALLAGASSVMVPGTWNSDANGHQNWGYATYRLRLLLPERHPALAIQMPAIGMSYQLFVNGAFADSHGSVGTTRETTVSGWRPDVHLLIPVDQNLELVIQVANFDDQTGGLSNALYLGEAESLFRVRQANLLLDIFLFGALFLMGLYYLGLFLYRRIDRSSLYFALLCLSLSIRQLCYGEMAINELFSALPFAVTYRMGYVLYCAGLLAFCHFIHSLFPAESLKLATRIIDGVSGVYAALCLLAPAWVFASLLVFYQLFTLLTGGWILVVLARAIFRKRPGSISFLIGFLLMFAAAIHDMLKGYLSFPTPFLMPYGLMAFLFVQSLILTRKFAGAFAASEQFGVYLENLNQSLERFIPREILAFLKKDSIVDIKLGDHIEHEMTVMFTDIRDFTSLSESMSPRENFNFINSYLKRMGPIIRAHQGFVDKYMGDGIMALFPGKPDLALQAALAMNEDLLEYNANRAKMGYRPIRVGFGIHVGNLMMGTIGESRRMDSTVISDTVNVASRLEGLTKKFGATFLTSDELIMRLEHPEQFEFRFLGGETVKGKSVPVKVFELLAKTAAPAAPVTD